MFKCFQGFELTFALSDSNHQKFSIDDTQSLCMAMHY